jgi:hypothetical protein
VSAGRATMPRAAAAGINPTTDEIDELRYAPAMHMRCTCDAHAMRIRCTCDAHAMHMRCTCDAHAMHMRCT